jgi:exodeoxyribonuclease V alpha subunit
MKPLPLTPQVSAQADDAAVELVLPLNALDLAFARYLQEAQPSAEPRHAWLAALVSHQFGRGHACLDLDLLRESGVAALGWDSRCQSLLPDALADAAASLPWSQGEASPLVLDGPRLYLRRNWQAEQKIRASILARLKTPTVLTPTLATDLDALFPAKSHSPGQPDWQKVACALALRRRFCLITGGPGTGKTTTVVRLLALMQAQATEPLRIALAAPTGKAAARLGEAIGRAVQQLPAAMQLHIPTQAQTLHKLLKLRSAVQASEVPALALDLVVVDEASMIDLELMARLLAAVPISAHLILLGDKDQLASVEAGAVMGQLCEGAVAGHYSTETVNWLRSVSAQDVSAWAGEGSALAQQTVMLRHSHRFAASSVIGQWASAVNAGDTQAVAELWSATPNWQVERDASVTRLQVQRASVAALAALVQTAWQPWSEQLRKIGDQGCSEEQALDLLQALGRFQVLCALREGPWGVQTLNHTIAQALGFVSSGWYAGRPVMITRNDYNLNLMNGDVGLCLPTPKGLRVAFTHTTQDGQIGVRWVLPSRLDAVETVFAMTVHKSQGSEFEHVALVLPERITPVLSRELLYTGITRAKSQLTLVVPQAGVLRQAVKQQVVRSGGLGMEKF